MSNPLLARFAGEPALVAPHARDRFEACLAAVMAAEHGPEMVREGAAAEDGFWPEPGSWRAAYRPYVVTGGVLQIPVKGVLLHDFSFAVGSLVTGYVYIRRAFERGMADPEVRGIALICDSPGGEVAGNFDLVDVLYAARGAKPVRAFAHEGAYSAAYSIASAADRIIVSRTGGVGSIGVVTAHIDASGALAQAGLKVTFIFAGEHKVDGNSAEPLPPEVKDRIQARIDGLYDIFVAAVARNRSLKETAVRATKALTYAADEAIRTGLADAVGALDDAVAAFAAELTPTAEDPSMITPEAHEAAVAAARADGEAAGRTAGEAVGATAAKVRIKAILGSDEAKGRQDLAEHLAFDTDMAAEAAVAVLAKAPKMAPAAAEGADFLAAMRAQPNPDLGTGRSHGADQGPSLADRMRARFDLPAA
ncbi:S49 family peptidase [Methylobacterium nodulans]|uniref:Peptidase S49 n=1 Tax=Methylobacterium nodulans (strain LMG 21967 / CNCM I-2342 / ORS 2060) TaxID=460265 RepID=B8IDR0_METNO|nr:S49 family peptidase [Methylobacterium nodulans]ACL55632.1 peptidase S49 [Methylobacterium nodulans ORS 2060]